MATTAVRQACETPVTARQRADWRAEPPDEDGVKTGSEIHGSEGRAKIQRDRGGWYRRTRMETHSTEQNPEIDSGEGG